MTTKTEAAVALKQLKLRLARLYIAACVDASGNSKPDKMVNSFEDAHSEATSMIDELLDYLQTEESS